MEAKELRIGCYYRYCGSADIQMDKNELCTILDIGGEYKWEPIQLTEEWLIKFGFRIVLKINTHYYIQDPNGYKDNHKIHIFPTLNNIWHIAFSDILSGKEVTYIPTTKIKYVHQLQNLFFALTNTELQTQAGCV